MGFGMRILAGDMGGTHTRLQLLECTEASCEVLAKGDYACAKFASFSAVIREFLSQAQAASQKIDSICFAIAGPIVEGCVKFTNLPWSIELAQLRKDFQLDRIALINDFQAIGYGIETLGDKDVHTLQTGRPQLHGIRAVIGAGTGLGVGFMYWSNDHYVVSPTEGGHVNFAPNDDVQSKILDFLRKKYRRVSSERLISGMGIENIYQYFCSALPDPKMENPQLRLALHNGEGAAAIVRFALQEHDMVALQTVDTFIRIYGSQTGDLAYTLLPFGGLYIAGGIAPKLLKQMTDGRFMEAFSTKGRLSKILEDVPLHIILNTDVGLQGAGRYAYRMALTKGKTS